MTVSKAEHDRIVQSCLTQVNHRANNLLAVIQGIIRMSTADDIESYKRVIEGRISALAQAHSLLSAGNWESVPLKDLVVGELINFVDPRSSRIHIEGVDVMLPGPRAQNAAMIMHELACNAAQHGALRTSKGEITVRWAPEEDHVHYAWYEDGQDDVKEPAKLGTGLQFVERVVRSTRARIVIKWPRSGVRIDMYQPYDALRPRDAFEVAAV